MNSIYKWVTSHSWIMPVIQLIAGLAVCQLLAVFYMAHFYGRLVSQTQDASSLYPFFIPSLSVLKGTGGFKDLFSSALFFSTSIGCGISVVSVVALYLAKIAGRFSTIVTLIGCGAWFYLLMLVNTNGFSLFASGCFVLIPLTIRWIDKKVSADIRFSWFGISNMLLFILFLLIVYAGWFPAGKQAFVSVRDRLLLTNSHGVSATHFYYRYSFLAAASIESLEQKRLRTWTPATTDVTTGAESLEAIMQQNRYQLVTQPANADLTIGFNGQDLLLNQAGSTVLVVSLEHFQQQAVDYLHRFSEAADRFEFLRLFAYFSLLIGFPIVLVSFLFSGLRLAVGCFLPEPHAGITAALGVLLVGVVLLFVVFFTPDISVSRTGQIQEPVPTCGFERQAMFAYLQKQHLDIYQYADPNSLLQSRYILDRLWLAKLLADSNSPQRIDTLQVLLEDPDLVVRCQAMRSLGRLGAVSAVPGLRRIFTSTTSWYLQDCAFESLSWLP